MRQRDGAAKRMADDQRIGDAELLQRLLDDRRLGVRGVVGAARPLAIAAAGTVDGDDAVGFRDLVEDGVSVMPADSRRCRGS